MKINIIDSHFSQLVTPDIDSFNRAIETDEWNEALYSLLVRMFLNEKLAITIVTKNYPNEKQSVKTRRPTVLKAMLVKLSNSISRIFSGNKDVFVIAPHMPFWTQICSIRLRQFPVFWFREPKITQLKTYLLVERRTL